LLRDVAASPMPTAAPLIPAPVVFVPLGGEIYFAAWDLTEGLELRASDGTAAGTRTVRDACPGSCSGFWGWEMVESNGVLYFPGDDGVHGRELWRSDGTRAGTRMVAESSPGLNVIPPQFITPAPGGVYFVATDASHGSELWWSDGTSAGTHLVIDLLPGNPGGYHDGPTHLAWLPGAGLVFAAEDESHGRELWLTQGTEATTVMLADINPGAPGGLAAYQPFPDAFESPRASGGKVYFAADDGVHGRELWVTDGTAAGTSMASDIVLGSAGSDPWPFYPFEAGVLFSAGASGSRTLWRSDGTPAGTLALGDAAHGSGNLRPFDFATLGGTVYFPGLQDATGRELWATDGTLAGTHLAVEVNPGPASGVVAFFKFAAAEGRLWFTADDGVHGLEWWQSDGSGSGTFQVADLIPGAGGSVDLSAPGKPAGVAGHVLFNAFDNDRFFAVRAGQPGVVGTEVVHAAGDSAGSAAFCSLWNCPGNFTAVSAGVAFMAADASHGLEAWISDGTDAGTRLVADVAPGPSFGMYPYMSVDNRAPLANDLLLIASECATPNGCSESDFQLWRSTPEGVLTELTHEAWSLAPTGVTSWNDTGFLAASNGIWRSDGSPAGTTLLGGGPAARWFTPATDALYFTAADLWRTDGTPAGTQPLGGGTHTVTQRPVLTIDGGGAEILYFAANDAIAGDELWMSDGTDGGTRRVVDLRPGAASGIPVLELPGFEERSLLAALGPKVFFAGDEGSAGEELWVSDGSPGNATLLEIRPGPAGSEPRWVTASGGLVYFVADDGTHGREPWVTDGTPAGTHILADVRPGVESSTPRELVDWMGRLVFAADDDVHGMELWRADATGSTAALVTDLRPGVAPSSPQGLTAVGERLYFFADDGTTGLEPWVWSAAAGLFTDGFETGATSRWSRVASP
jgi:ELWxxDGT repeat protein